MRLNDETRDWGFTYQTHPSNEELRDATWLVDSMVPAHLETDCGWKDSILGVGPHRTLGRELEVRLKDFGEGRLKTLALPVLSGHFMGGSGYAALTLLMRGRWDYAISRISKLYVGRPTVLDPNMDIYRKPEAKASGNADAGPRASPEALARAAIDFELKTEEVLAARPD